MSITAGIAASSLEYGVEPRKKKKRGEAGKTPFS